MTNPHKTVTVALRRQTLHKTISELAAFPDLRPWLSPEHQAVLDATGGYAEIAFQLKLPLGTVKSRLCRARAELERLRGGGKRGRFRSQPPVTSKEPSA